MKKRLTINALAKSSLKHRKKQYTVMIIGIMIAMIFSSTIAFLASSMFNSIDTFNEKTYGHCDQFVVTEKGDEKLYEQMQKDGIITEYGFSHGIGAIFKDKENEDYAVNIAWLDEKAKELHGIELLEGEYPSEEGEIVLDSASLRILGLDIVVGDTFKVQMKGADGTRFLKESREKTFKLTGITLNKRSNLTEKNYKECLLPSGFVFSESEAVSGYREALGAYCNLGEDQYYAFSEKVRAEVYKDNKISMRGANAFNDFSDEGTYTYIIFTIAFAVVLLLASFMGIINAMTTNLSDRKKQIGMLRTVGATKKQIMKIFGREAVLISLICAPISTLVSIFTVKIVGSFLGEAFSFTPNLLVVVFSAAFGVFSVMIASVIPLYSASKISPVQTIRNIEATRKMKTKKIKSQKSFSIPKLLSKRNLSFYRRKQALVTLLLAITIVFSCYGFAFVERERSSMSSYATSDYTLILQGYMNQPFYNVKDYMDGFSENQRRDLINNIYIGEVEGSKKCYCLVEYDNFSDYLAIVSRRVGPDYVPGDETEEESYKYVKGNYGFEKDFFDSDMSSLDEKLVDSLQKFVTEGKINIDKLNSGEEIILIAPKKVAAVVGPTLTGFDYDDDIEEGKDYQFMGERPYKAGDTLKVSTLLGEEDPYDLNRPKNVKRTTKEVKIGAIIENLGSAFWEFHLPNDFGFLTTTKGMDNFCEGTKYNSFRIFLKDRYKTEMTDDIDSEITDVLNRICATVNDTYFNSNYENEKENELTMDVIFLLILSMMIIFLVGSAGIINNSLTSRIRESKREMGILRAVGATQKDLTESYIRQLMSMFGVGTVLGFVSFTVIYIGIYIHSKIKHYSMPFDFILWPAIISSLILFVICSFNLYFKIKKETKNSIIDNIREL